MKSTSHLAHYRVLDAAIHSVEKHSTETSLLAKKFSGKIGLDLVAELMGLLHDLGKYSHKYQFYIKSAVGLLSPEDSDYVDPKKYKGKIDHSTAGAQWIWKALRDEAKIVKLGAEIVSLCVISHHSGLLDMLDISGEDKFTARLNRELILTCYEEVKEKIHHSISERIAGLIESAEKNDQFEHCNLDPWFSW